MIKQCIIMVGSKVFYEGSCLGGKCPFYIGKERECSKPSLNGVRIQCVEEGAKGRRELEICRKS